MKTLLLDATALGPAGSRVIQVKDSPSENGQHRLVIRADVYNQCYIEATVGENGAPVRFLMDSGSGDGLAFNEETAGRLGYNPASLRYDTQRGSTNGPINVASIVVSAFSIGSFVLRDVHATVNSKGGAQLLGAPILSTLHFQVLPGFCVVTLPGAEDVKPANPTRRVAHDRPAPRL